LVKGQSVSTHRWVMHPIPLGLSAAPRSLAMQGCAMHFYSASSPQELELAGVANLEVDESLGDQGAMS